MPFLSVALTQNVTLRQNSANAARRSEKVVISTNESLGLYMVRANKLSFHDFTKVIITANLVYK